MRNCAPARVLSGCPPGRESGRRDLNPPRPPSVPGRKAITHGTGSPLPRGAARGKRRGSLTLRGRRQRGGDQRRCATVPGHVRVRSGRKLRPHSSNAEDLVQDRGLAHRLGLWFFRRPKGARHDAPRQGCFSFHRRLFPPTLRSPRIRAMSCIVLPSGHQFPAPRPGAGSRSFFFFLGGFWCPHPPCALAGGRAARRGCTRCATVG